MSTARRHAAENDSVGVDVENQLETHRTAEDRSMAEEDVVWQYFRADPKRNTKLQKPCKNKTKDWYRKSDHKDASASEVGSTWWGRWVKEAAFVQSKGSGLLNVRRRSPSQLATIRKPAQITPQEVGRKQGQLLKKHQAPGQDAWGW